MEFVKREIIQQSWEKIPDVPGNSTANSSSKTVKTISCSSQLKEEKFSYTWKIFDFDEIPFVNVYPIFSPAFYINKKNSSRWQIAMTKHTCSRTDGNDEGDDFSDLDDDESFEEDRCEKKDVKHEKIKRLGFRLVKFENTTDIWDSVRYSFSVKILNGIIVLTEEREEPGLASFQSRPKVPRYAFLTEKDSGMVNLFEEKYLEVTCNVKYSYVESGTTLAPVAYEGKQFIEDLRVLFVSNKHVDVQLIVNGEPYDTAHKIVLNAAVPGLEKLLEDKDQKKDVLDLKLDSEVGKAMVDFIYSGKIMDGFPVGKCADLRDAAIRYGVDCLEQYCSNYFETNLAPESPKACLGVHDEAGDCLKSAKKLGVEKVKKFLASKTCSGKDHIKQL